MPVFHHGAGTEGFFSGCLPQVAVSKFEACLERGGSGTLVVHGFQGISVNPAQGFGEFLLCEEHSGRVCLYDADAVVPVDYKSGQTVTFSVNKPVAIRDSGFRQTEGPSGLETGFEPGAPEVNV